MKTILLATLGAAIGMATVPALAQGAGTPPLAKPEFLGIDADKGTVYYNGRNSGRYCVYRTVEHFNRVTGYMEQRRVRHCGRGLYVR